ncbi:protein I'm not dead yet [Helicoverpa armigera]|uniref:protein I'm not dead yet n=1 Tax=Helicoverpa armigera TaxID=29058 RepID=UPI003082DD29
MAEEVTDQTEPQEDRLSAETEDDIKLTRRKKLTLFLSVYWRGLLCLLTPIILLLMLLPFPPQKYQWAGYTLCLMAVFWVTECIPLTITSFLPIVIFPLTGIMDTRTTCLCYINDTVLMFCGSMILAQAVEQSGLHQRLALHTISLIGYSHYRLLFAMSITTMFISMWITNTAASSMMVPIIFALLDVFEKQNLIQVYDLDSDGVQVASDITTCYFCAASFSATIGGIGTLVGTATNLVFKGLFERAYPSAPEYLSFPKFSAFSIPYMLVLEAGLYFYMIFMYLGFLRPKTKAAQSTQIPESGVEAARNTVEETLKKMGKITFWEIMVIILFSGVVVMFFSRAPQIFYGWGDYISDYYGLNNNKFVQDSAAAFLVCFLMLLLPSNLDFFRNFYVSEDELPNKPVPSVLDWTVMNKNMPYSFMFLLGGGFALSEAAKKEYSDLNGYIGNALRHLNIFPNYFIILLIIIFTVFITNFASNVSVCNIVTPIVMQLGKEINIHPLWYNIASGISASFCFCLPVGTPGNLVIQGAAKIPTMKMVKAGVGPTVTTILLTWISMCFWAPVVWPDLNKYTSDLSWMDK